MRIIKYVLSVFILFFCSLPLLAQDAGFDFRNLNVNELSEQQIIQLYERMQERGLSIAEVETMALARGMEPAEITKLRNRINQIRSSRINGKETEDQQNRLRGQNGETAMDAYNRMQIDTLDQILGVEKSDSNKVFGSEVFANQTLSFEPSLNIPTPENYSLGPGDEVIIDIWGASERTYQLTISPEGAIQIEGLGPVFLNGLTIEKANQRLSDRLSQIYSGLKGEGQNTYMQVTLGNVRSINVSLVGEVKWPGTYTLSSFASVFNALYAAGGPTDKGTYRSVKILRDGSLHKEVDLYDFLVAGDLTDNIILKDQDIIKVDPYINRITVLGETKHIGLFEALEGETFEDVLEFAGGFNQYAYQKRVKVDRKTNSERRIIDIHYPDQANMVMKSGDIVTVQKVLDRYENRVTLEGAVFRPGEYQLEENPTLSTLIENADGLMGDAYFERAIIYRTKDNYEVESIPVNLNEIMSDTAGVDVELEKDDRIKISSIFDLRELRTIKINGSIQNPGTYKYVENISLKDLIYEADGFKEEAAPYNIEIARRIPDNEEGSIRNNIADIITVNVENGLAYNPELEEVILQPFDQVFVRKSPSYEKQKTVKITGEVLYPGEYALSTRDFRLSDLIEKSGGITKYAYAEGASLTRDFEKDVEEVDINIEDSVTTQQVHSLSQVGIQLQKALAEPNSDFDLLLQPGDEIVIPKRLQTVQVRGEVLYPVNVRFEEKRNFRSYISAAGGLTEQANNKRAYIVYANGEVDRTKQFLFFRSYPEVKPGSVLIIPPKEQKDRLSTGELISILSTIVSMAAIVTNTIFQIRRN